MLTVYVVYMITFLMKYEWQELYSKICTNLVAQINTSMILIVLKFGPMYFDCIYF